MTKVTDRNAALLEGPPARTPERVAADTAARGRRVILSLRDGTWRHDLRAVDDPFMHDPTTKQSWYPTAGVPDGVDFTEASLHVAVCTEQGWYDWQRTKVRPAVEHYPAYLLWIE